MKSSTQVSGRLLSALLVVIGGVIAQTVSSQTILASTTTANCFLSGELWQSLVEILGGHLGRDEQGRAIAEVDFLPLLGLWLLAAGLSWLLAARLVRRNAQISWSDSLATAGLAFGWWWLMGVWELLWIVALGFGWESLANLVLGTPQFWQATALAGWLVHPFCFHSSPPHLLSSALRHCVFRGGLGFDRVLQLLQQRAL